MNTYIPTIETLLGKTENELNAIFRKANEAAASAEISAEDREAARQTAAKCRTVLDLAHKPGF